MKKKVSNEKAGVSAVLEERQGQRSQIASTGAYSNLFPLQNANQVVFGGWNDSERCIESPLEHFRAGGIDLEV